MSPVPGYVFRQVSNLPDLDGNPTANQTAKGTGLMLSPYLVASEGVATLSDMTAGLSAEAALVCDFWLSV